MDAVKEITPEGRGVWHIARGWTKMVDLLGDDFDYSKVTRAQLHDLAEDLRDILSAREAKTTATKTIEPPKTAEASNDETALAPYCRSGHGEQAQAFMLNGVPPHRCPQCGHTPEFRG